MANINRDENSIDKLVNRITQFIDNAPPKHIHTNGAGNVLRVVP